MLHKRPVFFVIASILTILSAAARADGGDNDLERLLGGKNGTPPAVIVKKVDKDDALRLTSNKDELVRLDQDAASVIVNNPDHASVMLDSPRLLIIMPRLPGATSFTVLNSAGEVILTKDIIVTNVQRKYVRVRRACASGDASCIPAAYYYCPDGCYEVTPVTPTGSSAVPPPGAAAASAAANLGPGAQAPNVGGGNGTPGEPGISSPPVVPQNTNPVGPDGEPLTYPGQTP